jgi:hypothetical protein
VTAISPVMLPVIIAEEFSNKGDQIKDSTLTPPRERERMGKRESERECERERVRKRVSEREREKESERKRVRE